MSTNESSAKAIKTKGHFPNEDAARKLIYRVVHTFSQAAHTLRRTPSTLMRPHVEPSDSGRWAIRL